MINLLHYTTIGISCNMHLHENKRSQMLCISNFQSYEQCTHIITHRLLIMLCTNTLSSTLHHSCTCDSFPNGCFALLLMFFFVYPLVNVYIAMENHHAINGKIHYKWPFSIAMLVHQRVMMFLGFCRGLFSVVRWSFKHSLALEFRHISWLFLWEIHGHLNWKL